MTFTPNAFIYDSSKLSQLRDFVTSNHLQIMVLTMASFNSENNILNQVEREDFFNNQPHLKTLAQTHPILFMDEPQRRDGYGQFKTMDSQTQSAVQV